MRGGGLVANYTGYCSVEGGHGLTDRTPCRDPNAALSPWLSFAITATPAIKQERGEQTRHGEKLPDVSHGEQADWRGSLRMATLGRSLPLTEKRSRATAHSAPGERVLRSGLAAADKRF